MPFSRARSEEGQLVRYITRARGDILWILRAFAERGGPIPVSEVEAAFTEWPATAVRDELAMLDEHDLIVLVEQEISLAYPFSATPTPFLVRFADGRERFADGRERFACCATDALGIAAMLGARISIRTPCHHCGEPLALTADSTGPLGPGGGHGLDRQA